jgi:hypothetical protein
MSITIQNATLGLVCWDPTSSKQTPIKVEGWRSAARDGHQTIQITFGDPPELMIGLYGPMLEDLHTQMTDVLADLQNKETSP